MASRISKGCLRCRTRRVKCDEGRPSCRRCVQRNEICAGYRDEASLVFRDENEKAARASARRRASTQSLSTTSLSTQSATSSQASSISRFSQGSVSGAHEDPSDLTAAEISSLSLASPYPWAKAVPRASAPSAEDRAVSRFFEKYVMYPCGHGSSPGFLEHLPSLFKEVKVEGRMALRWAVRAAAYANLSRDQGGVALRDKALQCYGLALSALGESLADPGQAPDDYDLMTVVVLDLFEAVYLPDSVSVGSHAQGMAQILRLRGPDQIYGARGWSLFRLSHHRLQKQQLIAKQGTLPESEVWLDSLNEELPYVRNEKDSFEMNKICEQARSLLKRLDDTDASVDQTLSMVKEMYALDRVATTWRDGPEWAYRTVLRSELTHDDVEAVVSQFPDVVQLHRDIWMAYEWNYHRTARIILHEHLLLCLDRLRRAASPQTFQTDLCFFTQTSLTVVQALVDEVLSTVPQSLGDVDRDGTLLPNNSSASTSCQGVGGYFLLWPIKISKSTRSATAPQRAAAQSVFERIRECTGMKSALGDRSMI